MPGNIIKATAVLNAEDHISSVIDKIAKSMKGVEAAAKTSVEVDKLARSLTAQQGQLQAINRLEKERIGLAEKAAGWTQRNRRWRTRRRSGSRQRR